MANPPIEWEPANERPNLHLFLFKQGKVEMEEVQNGNYVTHVSTSSVQIYTRFGAVCFSVSNAEFFFLSALGTS